MSIHLKFHQYVFLLFIFVSDYIELYISNFCLFFPEEMEDLYLLFLLFGTTLSLFSDLLSVSYYFLQI